MRVLLDEMLDRRLTSSFDDDGEIVPVGQRGWAGRKNSELLEAAQREFDALVTTDRSMPYQQNLARFDLAVVVVEARSNSYEDLTSLMDDVNDALRGAQPGTALGVEAGRW